MPMTFVLPNPPIFVRISLNGNRGKSPNFWMDGGWAAVCNNGIIAL